MAARLRAATTSGKPVLLRVDYGGGHFEGSSGDNEVWEAAADMMSFDLWQLGLARAGRGVASGYGRANAAMQRRPAPPVGLAPTAWSSALTRGGGAG